MDESCECKDEEGADAYCDACDETWLDPVLPVSNDTVIGYQGTYPDDRGVTTSFRSELKTM